MVNNLLLVIPRIAFDAICNSFSVLIQAPFWLGQCNFAGSLGSHVCIFGAEVTFFLSLHRRLVVLSVYLSVGRFLVVLSVDHRLISKAVSYLKLS